MLEPLDLFDYTKPFTWSDGPQCLFCGKALNPRTMKSVGLDAGNGFILPADQPSESCFEIGPECAKKLPLGYVHESPYAKNAGFVDGVGETVIYKAKEQGIDTGNDKYAVV